MLAAFLTQFPPATFTVRARSFLDTPEKLAAALTNSTPEPGIVLHGWSTRP
jgi:hypothetical protein